MATVNSGNDIEVRPSASGRSTYVGASRVRVSDVVRLHQQELSLKEILKALPHLTRNQILSALAYWETNRAAIASEIEEEEALLKTVPTKA